MRHTTALCYRFHFLRCLPCLNLFHLHCHTCLDLFHLHCHTLPALSCLLLCTAHFTAIALPCLHCLLPFCLYCPHVARCLFTRTDHPPPLVHLMSSACLPSPCPCSCVNKPLTRDRRRCHGCQALRCALLDLLWPAAACAKCRCTAADVDFLCKG